MCASDGFILNIYGGKRILKFKKIAFILIERNPVPKLCIIVNRTFAVLEFKLFTFDPVNRCAIDFEKFE